MKKMCFVLALIATISLSAQSYSTTTQSYNVTNWNTLSQSGGVIITTVTPTSVSYQVQQTYSLPGAQAVPNVAPNWNVQTINVIPVRTNPSPGSSPTPTVGYRLPVYSTPMNGIPVYPSTSTWYMKY